MYENREISCTSWSKDQDRSGKAKNRTADMHVQEKSDCAVVPVNQSNKEVQASAEIGEGRAQIEENIARSCMSPTQSGTRMSQGLRGVRKAATERKQEKFTALLHHVTVDLLRDSFYVLQRRAAPGVDGVTLARVRDRIGGSTCRSAQPGSPESVPGTTIKAGLHSES